MVKVDGERLRRAKRSDELTRKLENCARLLCSFFALFLIVLCVSSHLRLALLFIPFPFSSSRFAFFFFAIFWLILLPLLFFSSLIIHNQMSITWWLDWRGTKKKCNNISPLDIFNFKHNLMLWLFIFVCRENQFCVELSSVENKRRVKSLEVKDWVDYRELGRLKWLTRHVIEHFSYVFLQLSTSHSSTFLLLVQTPHNDIRWPSNEKLVLGNCFFMSSK